VSPSLLNSTISPTLPAKVAFGCVPVRRSVSLKMIYCPIIRRSKRPMPWFWGAPSISRASTALLAFISRLWGFGHVSFAIKGKPFALAISGSGDVGTDTSVDDFRRALRPFQVNIVDVVSYYSRVPPCYSCGRHQECRIGGAYMIWGKNKHPSHYPGPFPQMGRSTGNRVQNRGCDRKAQKCCCSEVVILRRE
jgi:hypothetical protein